VALEILSPNFKTPKKEFTHGSALLLEESGPRKVVCVNQADNIRFRFFCFFSVLGLELRAFTLSHSTSPIFVIGFFERVSRTICPGWFQAVILLISAS
jgi:hypothetical protein